MTRDNYEIKVAKSIEHNRENIWSAHFLFVPLRTIVRENAHTRPIASELAWLSLNRSLRGQITDVNEIKVRKWLSNKQRHPELRVHREGGPVCFNVKFIEKR